MFCTFLSSHESILVDYDLQESWWQFDPMLCGLFQFCVMISGAKAGALLLKLEPIVVEFIRSSWNLRFPFKRFIYLPIDTYLVYVCSSEIRPRVDFLLTFFQLKVLTTYNCALLWIYIDCDLIHISKTIMTRVLASFCYLW